LPGYRLFRTELLDAWEATSPPPGLVAAVHTTLFHVVENPHAVGGAVQIEWDGDLSPYLVEVVAADGMVDIEYFVADSPPFEPKCVLLRRIGDHTWPG